MARVAAVITVVVITLVALVGLAIVGATADIATDSSGLERQVFQPAPSEPTTVAGIPEDATVKATTGDGLRLGGNGSYVSDPADPAVVRQGAWAVAIVVEPGETVDQVDTRTVYAKDNETIHLLYERGEWTLRAENGTGATAYANASASLDGTTTLSGAYNESAGVVELYVNGSLVDTAPYTTETVARDPAADWIGTVDEVRLWNRSLARSEHRAYHREPARAITGARALRLMFDGDRVFTAHFASGDATGVGATEQTDGVADPGLDRGADYRIDTDAETIETADGGLVDGAPVLLVGGGGSLPSTVGTVVDGVAGALELLPVALLGLVATIAIVTIQRLRDQQL